MTIGLGLKRLEDPDLDALAEKYRDYALSRLACLDGSRFVSRKYQVLERCPISSCKPSGEWATFAHSLIMTIFIFPTCIKPASCWDFYQQEVIYMFMSDWWQQFSRFSAIAVHRRQAVLTKYIRVVLAVCQCFGHHFANGWQQEATHSHSGLLQPWFTMPIH